MKTVVSEPRHIEELLGRSAVYQVLAVLVRHPDETTRKWLLRQEHQRLPEVVEMLTKERNGQLHEAARRVVRVLDSASVAQWGGEHERIFGHSVQSAAPPYELEYGEEHSHRQPQELGDLAAFYQAFGLRVSATSHERADHIVTECEFLQYLFYKQACTLDEEAGSPLTSDVKGERAEVCHEAARHFLADHLGRWGPAFALRLSRSAGGEVLTASGELLLAWLMQECARMQVAAGSIDLPLRSPKEADVGCASCALNSTRDDGDA
jgi:TorA maturation chaperone TorD